LAIYPEGFTHNGLYLHRFKRGAFASECAIQPFISLYEWDLVHPGYETVNDLQSIVLMMSEMKLKNVHYDLFPIFVPNEYLFTTYRQTLPGGA